MSDRYLVCGCTPWARRVFDERLALLPGEWHYVDSPKALDDWSLVPWRAIFFLHWRWKVPKAITDRYECIGFHLGHLPEERGGSPLQWRIVGGNESSTLTMFRLTDEIDTGDIIDETEVALHGTAEAVYARCMEAAADAIEDWLDYPQHYPPRAQVGEPHAYARRTPEDSRLPEGVRLEAVYDRIRMVDAEGYPYAFLDYGRLRFTFRRAVEYDGRIEADVTITEIPHE